MSEVLITGGNGFLGRGLAKKLMKNHRVILGLAWSLQVMLLANLFIFFKGELESLKVVGRVIMLCIMAPMVISNNKKVHEIGMGIFLLGFIYTILKYHVYAVI